MHVTITKVNGKRYYEKRKEVRDGIFIPDCFKDEAQFDRWFNETLLSGKYRLFHLRENNHPVTQQFEDLELQLKFS